jgi:DNA topoisomerase I
MSNLVIVESPTKARTLAKFLGKGYRIEASMGHIRDLPKAEIGVNVDDNYEPRYIIPRDKKKRVNELKKIASEAKTIWLASDPDREGEAIAWHIAALLKEGDKKNKPRTDQELKRVVFHEITEGAIKEAFLHPRELDFKLIDAQQARRVLDRLVGYKLSPLLWKKVKRGLSAGRVQSVALRLIAEREREISAFNAIEYWSIEVEVSKKSGEQFTIELIEVNGEKAEVKTEKEAQDLVQKLETASYQVAKITQREVRRLPAAPFTTSTLQQTSGNKLGMSAKKTMMVAQNLYEQGYITYMRTDSVNLSTTAISQAREFIQAQFGEKYLPASARVFKSRSKNAQEAHEAIRPTNFNIKGDDLKGEHITRDHKRLYELIYKRTVASQMTESIVDQTTVDVKANPNGSADILMLRATGSVLKFDGWLKLYGVKQYEEEEVVAPEGTEGEKKTEDKKQMLPKLEEGEGVDKQKVSPLQHFTQPPPRYTEASLVKKLEELGIGRPSTYAPIISTIQDRFYVERQERKFVPTALGFAVNDFLFKYFPELFDYTFTAQMEDRLDEISRGEREWKATIGEFYKPFEGILEKTEESAEKVVLEVETVDKQCPKCGKQLIVRTGRFGKFLACSGFPECKHTEAIVEQIGDVKCPDDGGDIVVRKTKRGKTFYGCKNWPECKFASWTKPK